MTKGTSIKDLMWIYADERMSDRQRYIKSGKGKVNYNRKLYKNYRCERVMNKLLNLERIQFYINSSQRGASNAGN
ncbi:MarR family transcriptional regulator [Providencia sp. Je.9.19]|uniref:MarR family transcriptional regulator n=1 Tax=Providencia sp. Je.9.19 TaxID=3142844 RepID=UPI003DA8AC3A